jgi:tetratricopeptide (TPR) repeat protein
MSVGTLIGADRRLPVEPMTCPTSFPLTDDALEDYLLGRLDEETQRRIEEHYFACPSCLARVELFQELRPALSRGSRGPTPLRPRIRSRIGPFVAAAAALAAIAVVVWRMPARLVPTPASGSSTSATAAPDSRGVRVRELEQLAKFEAPEYRRPSLRNAPATSADFEAAMELYTREDYAGAAARLAPLAAVRSDAEVLFFLGISQLMIGRHEAGMARLEQAAASGDTPYLEPALYYLAKAHLARGDTTSAVARLDAVIRLRGDLEAAARGLRDRVQNLRR